MFDTERNHPIRVCAIAWPFSQLMLAMSNGMSTKPMPYSMKNWWPVSSAKVEMIEGATLRWRQPTTLLLASSAASMRSTEAVVEAVLDVVLAGPLTRTGAPSPSRIAASSTKSHSTCASKPPPRSA